MNKWIYAYHRGNRARFTLTNGSNHAQPFSGSCLPFSCFRECPGRNLFSEVPSLERSTKNPEQGPDRTGFINPARGGTILLRFQDSSVVRSNQSTDEISSEEP
jgi:hypothetical protein